MSALERPSAASSATCGSRPRSPKLDPELLGGRERGAGSMERRQAGGEAAPQGRHPEHALRRGDRRGQVSGPGIFGRGFQRRPQPPRLVAREGQEHLQLGGRVGTPVRAVGTGDGADPPQALGEPSLPAAPLERGHQDLDRFNHRCQIHRGHSTGSDPLRCRPGVKFP